MRKWPAQVSTVVANVGRELSLLKMAINMANADYLSFFLWNELEPRCQQRAAGALELHNLITRRCGVGLSSVRQTDQQAHTACALRTMLSRYLILGFSWHCRLVYIIMMIADALPPRKPSDHSQPLCWLDGDSSFMWFVLHWKGNAFIWMKFSFLPAQKVVKMTIFGAAYDANFVKMTGFSFQCKQLTYRFTAIKQMVI